MEIACKQNYPGNERSRGEQKPVCELPIQKLPIRIRPAQEMIPSKVPVDPYAIVNNPRQRHLLIQSGFNSSSSSVSPRDLKRKRLCAEDGKPPTRSIPMNYSSFPVACHPLLPDTFMNMPESQQQGDWITWDTGMGH